MVFGLNISKSKPMTKEKNLTTVHSALLHNISARNFYAINRNMHLSEFADVFWFGFLHIYANIRNMRLSVMQ